MTTDPTGHPLLFTPISIKGVTARNRVVISPMCQYSATDGMANDWHLTHLAKFATGGAGLVFTEAVAVEARGRITHGDLGIWSDVHAQALEPIVDFLKRLGAVPAIQIAHAGRKASMQRPWFGNGPLGEEDTARGDLPWETFAASALPVDDGWLVPKAATGEDIATIVTAFAEAASRAHAAGFEALEIHGAHGYLINSFLSPISNRRTDQYGGGRSGRMRLALEVTEAVRGGWPEDKPLFFRVSAVDGVEGGWQLEDSVVLTKELKALGVDVMDCSSGGIGGSATAVRVKRSPGFQVPYAAHIRREAEIMTQAVGLITEPEQAEAILQAGDADLIAIGREALYNPFWPRHAAQALQPDRDFADWPEQYGWWLDRWPNPGKKN